VTRSVILAGARTPIGRINGALSTLSAVELGTLAATAALERSGVTGDDIQHVNFGQVLQAGAGQNPARQVGFRLGLDRTVTADTINRVCGSGLRAVTFSDMAIRLGDHRVVLAGGMESMSQAPYILRQARQGYRAGNGSLDDLVYADGLICAQDEVLMGVHGSTVAAEHDITREQQDEWALCSHRRALAAQDRGRFEREVIAVEIIERKSTRTVTADEAPRRDTSLEALARLKPAFGAESSVTAGNAPGLSDGAAAVIVADEAWAQERSVPVAATILATGQSAWDPAYLAYTPELAIRQALGRAGLDPSDLDLVEINEAFASVAIISAQRLGVSPEIVNVDGGAIAIGHPLAASGVRILLSLISSLQERGGGIGAVGICSGGGQGDAMIVKVEAA